MYYDPEWLAIVIEAQSSLTTAFNSPAIPDRFTPSEQTEKLIRQIEKDGKLRIDRSFTRTAESYTGKNSDEYDGTLAVARGNDQTDAYLEMLQLNHVVTIPFTQSAVDPNALDLDDLSIV